MNTIFFIILTDKLSMGFLKTLFTGKRDELSQEEMVKYEELHKNNNEPYQLNDENDINNSNLHLNEVLKFILTLSSPELVKLKNQIAQREDDISKGISSFKDLDTQLFEEDSDNSLTQKDLYPDISTEQKDEITSNKDEENKDLIELAEKEEYYDIDEEKILEETKEVYLDDTNNSKSDLLEEDNSQVQEFVEIDEISVSKALPRDQEQTSKDDPTLFSIIHDELMEVFEEGRIILLKEEFSFPSIGSRETLAFGIFNSDYSKISDQTHWFIQNLKRFSRLKECKMLLSEENEKDLILEVNDKYAILISFKTSNLVKNSFEFNRKWD
ncbi:MAG: hypothetical protein ACMXYB_05190 [Candidatus Woesearchaeota archaeon]